MTYTRTTKSIKFNFRIRPQEMELLKKAAETLNCFSVASFIRIAIMEKIKRELKNE
jgi:hypothetical protein